MRSAAPLSGWSDGSLQIQEHRRLKLANETQIIQLTSRLDESESSHRQVLPRPSPCFRSHAITSQMARVIEELTREKLVLEEKFLSLSLVSHGLSEFQSLPLPDRFSIDDCPPPPLPLLLTRPSRARAL